MIKVPVLILTVVALFSSCTGFNTEDSSIVDNRSSSLLLRKDSTIKVEDTVTVITTVTVSIYAGMRCYDSVIKLNNGLIYEKHHKNKI